MTEKLFAHANKTTVLIFVISLGVAALGNGIGMVWYAAQLSDQVARNTAAINQLADMKGRMAKLEASVNLSNVLIKTLIERSVKGNGVARNE